MLDKNSPSGIGLIFIHYIFIPLKYFLVYSRNLEYFLVYSRNLEYFK